MKKQKKAIKILYDLISYIFKTTGLTNRQIAGFFAHGNESMNLKELLSKPSLKPPAVWSS